MRLKLAICFAVIAAVMLTACTPITETPPAATSTSEIEGLFSGTPVGLLPEIAEGTAEPVATIQPADLTDSQTVDTPELGLQLVIPSTWTLDHTDELLYTISDQDGTRLMEISYLAGFAPNGGAMVDQMRSFIATQPQHADAAEITVDQSVVGAYNFVVVSGPGLDACQYRYLLGGLSWIAIKFERPLCDGGDLNDTAFSILRSLSYSLPEQ